MRALAYKLKLLKTTLLEWNKTIFGNIFDAIKLAEHKVQQAESLFDNDPTPKARESLTREQANLFLCLCREETFLRKKTRVKWAAEGDANTRFFHATVRDKHPRQQINYIRSEIGNLLLSQDDIKAEVVHFFSHLYQCEKPEDVDEIVAHIPSILQTEDRDLLLTLITLSEVKKLVWDLDLDSAAGPDGFPIKIFFAITRTQ